jgi:hypothetical protein
MTTDGNSPSSVEPCPHRHINGMEYKNPSSDRLCYMVICTDCKAVLYDGPKQDRPAKE